MLTNQHRRAFIRTAAGIAAVAPFSNAFASALLVVRGLVAFVSRHGFAPFAWYRLALGLGILAWMAMR